MTAPRPIYRILLDAFRSKPLEFILAGLTAGLMFLLWRVLDRLLTHGAVMS